MIRYCKDFKEVRAVVVREAKGKFTKFQEGIEVKLSPCAACHNFRPELRFEGTSDLNSRELVRAVAIENSLYCKNCAFRKAQEREPELLQTEFEKRLALYEGDTGLHLYVYAVSQNPHSHSH